MTANLKTNTKLDEFRRGAEVKRKRAERADKPWSKLDRHAAPTIGHTLRLNEYQVALLEAVTTGQPTKTSKHTVMVRLLTEALEREASKL